jgi:superkiller protein 3
VKLLQQVGGALYLANDLMGAERAYRRIVELSPQDAVGWYNLGNVLAVRGQAEAAIGALEQAVAVKPDYFEAYNNLGALYRQARGPEAALEAYQHAARLSPGAAPAHYNLGRLRIELGDACGARDDLRRCVAIPDRGGVQPRCASLLREAERRCPA